MMIQRYSSRRTRLDQTVLTKRLEGAVSYDRIAGYFRSSLFEVAGEATADNTFVKGEGMSPRARRELLGHSQLSLKL